MATTPPPNPTKKSPFLDTLPPELRLRVYSHLLVASVPIKGPPARSPTTRYNLSTAILRVNKQINAEARSAFFGRNTFYITSLPSTRSSSTAKGEGVGEEEEEEGSGAFSPPLQLPDLPLVRHLEIDPLFPPPPPSTPTLRSSHHPGSGSSGGGGGEKKPSRAAQRYVLNLTYLLILVRPTLRSLSFTADARGYGVEPAPLPSSASLSPSSLPLSPSPSFSEDENENEEEEEDRDERDETSTLHIPTLLSAFQTLESHTRFLKAVSDLDSIKHLRVSFFFPESEFRFEVERQELCKRGLLFLACQTVFARSEIGIRAVLEGLERGEEEEEEGVGAFDGTRRGSVVQDVR